MSNELIEIRQGLDAMLTAEQNALPKGFNSNRFSQNCIAMLGEVKDISRYSRENVVQTLLKGAFLGLDFFSKECCAVPYGNELKFIIGYRGEKKLVKKYSIKPISDIYAKVVRMGDEFSEGISAGKPTISFSPKPFNNGDIVGAFAVVLYDDGKMQYEVMSKEEIDGIKNNYSKQSTGLAWTKSYGEMAKKTVMRRLCKHIETDFENTAQLKEFYSASDCEFEEPKKADYTVNEKPMTGTSAEILQEDENEPVSVHEEAEKVFATPEPSQTPEKKAYDATGDTRPISEAQRKMLFARTKQMNIGEDMLKGFLIENFAKDSSKELTREELQTVLDWIGA